METFTSGAALLYNSTFINDKDDSGAKVSGTISPGRFHHRAGTISLSLSLQVRSRCAAPTFRLPGVFDCAFRRRQRFLNACSISSGVTQLLPAAVAKFLASCRHSSNMFSNTADSTACAPPDMTHA